MATISGSRGSRWSAKQYIIAALVGVLVAVAVATAVSVSLAPARIAISVANATMSTVPVEGNPHLSNGFYNLTLVANNTSRRTAVWYGSLSAQIWYSATGWIPAEDVNTTAALPGWRPPRDATAVAAWAEYGQYDEKGNVTSSAMMTSEQLDAEKGSAHCRVVVQAKVWFRFGLSVTRPYTVTATCDRVDFVNRTTHFPVQCS